MKWRFPILGICWLALAGLVFAANPVLDRVIARTTYHPDKSRTESVRDPNTREMTETTYDANDVLTVRKHFLLNERGEPTQGNIYDGKGNLVARCISIYDTFQRRVEDRLMNLNGEVFQQVIHEYDANGKPKKPKVIHLNVKAPTIRPATVDFTQRNPQPAAGQPAAAPGTDRFAPTLVPGSAATPADGGKLPPIYAPGTEAAATTTTPPAEPPKKSFFKRLFEKKDK